MTVNRNTGEYRNTGRTGLLIAALVVLALIAGLILTNNNRGPENIEPAAGGNMQMESPATDNTTTGQ